MALHLVYTALALWSTYLGGVDGTSYASSVSAEAGAVYVTGGTNSELGPLARAAAPPFAAGAYVVRYMIPR